MAATALAVAAVLLFAPAHPEGFGPAEEARTILLLEENAGGGNLDRLARLLSTCMESQKSKCGFSVQTVPFRNDLNIMERLAEALQSAGKAPLAIAGVSGETAILLSKSVASLPVFFDSYHDPRRYCLVKSLTRPGTNATGVFGIPEIGDRMIQILTSAYPAIDEIIVIVDSERLGQADCSRRGPKDVYDSGACTSRWISRKDDIEQVIEPSLFISESLRRRLRLRFFLWCPDDNAEKLRALAKNSSAGIVVPVRESLFLRRIDLVRAIRKLGLPAVYQGRSFAANGGLIALKPIMPDAHAVIAAQVRQYISGRPVTEIPIEQPLLNEVVFNTEEAGHLRPKPHKDFLKIVDEYVVTQAPRQ